DRRHRSERAGRPGRHDPGQAQRPLPGRGPVPADRRGRQRVPGGGRQEGLAVPLRRIDPQALLRRHAQQDRLRRGGTRRARAGRREV
ncbi:MAG: hypothetical protein AVDCRST_MAG68-3069, partial [uncultured Gemmatimonadetes bacterium]